MPDCPTCHHLRAEIAALRAAVDLSEARADYRDRAKVEVAELLGLPPEVSIHVIIAEIRKLLR